MLYVFMVSSGMMVKFDMNLAVKKVLELKTEIAKCVHIPVEEQVLLCSGGEELKSENIVGNYYGAGTDTNPIFLFSRFANDTELFNTHFKTSIDLSIEDDVKNCAGMAPTSGAATVRSALAQRFAEAAVNGRRECDELVHGQHLQQQGWAAVIANLEDAKDSLLKRKAHFEELFQKYLVNRSSYKESIKTFPEDIELLAKVPLLPKLMLGNDCIEEDLEADHTLLSWFCSEPRHVLESLVEKCERSLEELDEHSLIALQEEVQSILKSVDNPDIKEVKGIEERLTLLNKQIEDAKKLEKDQRDLATWFNQTQGRISRDDPNVLSDLCRTFQNQLELMLLNHKCLKDILERCTKAKMELSESINYRIKYICRVESDMYDTQVRIIFLETHVKSLMAQIESFHQVHLAPERYLKMLAEVCRRKTFSSSFMKWATELSAQAFRMYQKEISWRQAFSSEESKNMVDNLFPGMDDLPPPFAIECPQPFDQNLPNILKEDLDLIKLHVPELSSFCTVLPSDPMPYISQVEADSAFNSTIPSSRLPGDSGDLEHTQEEKEQISLHKLAAPSGDYSSLPSEYTSIHNEVFSLTSSPFEDPLLPSSELDLTPKRTKASQSQSLAALSSASERKSLSVEEHTVLTEDGDEFETVDCIGTSIEMCSESPQKQRHKSTPRPSSSSDVIIVNKELNQRPKVSKALSEGDRLSRFQEKCLIGRLKGVCSEVCECYDIQGTDYYIDDSLPSSYTESSVTSKRVKSYQAFVAELQRQVEEKNSVLCDTASSLKNTSCNNLKLYAKISALQKFVHELQSVVRTDLSSLKEFVKEEFWDKMSEVSQVIESISKAMTEFQQQMVLEKEQALDKIRKADLEMESYRFKLEIERQKLSDAEMQIHNYEEHLQQLSSCVEEMKHEKEQLEIELSQKKDNIKSMTLEYELELDALRNQMNQDIQDRDNKILHLKQSLNKLDVEAKQFLSEKSKLIEELKQKEQEIITLQENANACMSKEEQCQELIKWLLECAKMEDESHSVQENKQQSVKSAEMSEQRQRVQEIVSYLYENHKNEMDAVQLHLEIGTTFERVPSPDTLEHIASKDLSVAQHVKNLEQEKEVLQKANEELQGKLKETEKKLEHSVMDAVNKEYARMKAERNKVVASIRQEYEEKFEKQKSRLTAENQVSFNEAISSLAKQKDAIIEDLRSKISILEAKQMAIKSHLDKYCAFSEGSEIQSDSCSSSSFHSSEEEKIFAKLKKEMEPYLELKESQRIPFPCPENQDPCEHLRKQLKEKEEEYEKLFTKFMDLASCSGSRGVPCIECTYKISLLTCNEGDLVLFCYEERHENFVVFYFGQYLHFLHADSIQPLGLKIPAEATDKWALGVVTNKEFCVTKKVNNRYKVNIGTKFYRVKVKPWDRQKAMTEYQAYRRQQMGSTIYSRASSIQSQPSEEGEKTKRSSSMSASAI